MTTIKQILAIEKTLENGGNITQAMREAGYREATINNPSNLTNSKGFQELCEKGGLTDDLLINALVEDIKTKKGSRKAELELAFKIKGRFVQKVDITSVEVPPVSADIQESINRFLMRDSDTTL